MQPQQLILLAVALAVGISSAWRNPTAFGLVVAFVVSSFGLPHAYFIFPDIFTLAMIFCKPRYQPCPAYWELTTWEQLKCIVTERAPADRFVMLSMPIAWLFYATVLSHTQYWVLWTIGLAQLVVVGVEPLLSFIRRRSAEAADHPDHGAMLVAYPGGGWRG